MLRQKVEFFEIVREEKGGGGEGFQIKTKIDYTVEQYIYFSFFDKNIENW